MAEERNGMSDVRHRVARMALTFVSTVVVPMGAAPAQAMEIGTNHAVVTWGAGATDPFLEGCQSVTASDPWKPAFLEETQLYRVHRFTDWGHVNGSTAAAWDERTKQSDADQSLVAYEWMIDLCNKQKAHMWVSVPHLADKNYWSALATLIRDNLESDLQVYLEYSHETWNEAWTQNAYCEEQGVALASDTDAWRAGLKFQISTSLLLFETFEEVFGDQNHRLVKVIAGDAADPFMTQVHLEALRDGLVNPRGTTADKYAIAPYFGQGVTSFDELEGEVRAAVDQVGAQSAALAGSGLSLIAYEGGLAAVANADQVSSDPRIQDRFREYLRGLEPYLEIFVHYAHAAPALDCAAWGAKLAIGEDSSKDFRYYALADYVAASLAPPSPEPPSELHATSVTHQVIELAWTDHADDETGFLVRREGGGGPLFEATLSVDATSYVDTGLASATAYVYQVCAVIDTGGQACSDTVTVTTLAAPTGPPLAPSQLQAVALSDEAIYLTWTDNANDETGFTVERGAAGGPLSAVTILGASQTHHEDAGLGADTAYTYRICATNAGGSACSGEATATTLPHGFAAIGQAPSAPGIDGVKDAVWSRTASYDLERVPVTQFPDDEADLSASWSALWDATNLYILVEVADDTMSINLDNPNAWQDDSVELFLDGDNSKQGSSDGECHYDGYNDVQWIFRPHDATVHVGFCATELETAGVVHAIEITGEGFFLEVKIPWSTLGVSPVEADLLGIDLHVADEDGELAADPDSKRSWAASENDSWGNPGIFGTARLMGSLPVHRSLVPGLAATVRADDPDAAEQEAICYRRGKIDALPPTPSPPSPPPTPPQPRSNCSTGAAPFSLCYLGGLLALLCRRRKGY